MQNRQLGGISVSIGSDLVGLRAGVAQAKAEVGRAERDLKIAVPVRIDTSKLRMEAASEIAKIQSSVRPLIIPIQFQTGSGSMGSGFANGQAFRPFAPSGGGGGMSGMGMLGVAAVANYIASSVAQTASDYRSGAVNAAQIAQGGGQGMSGFDLQLAGSSGSGRIASSFAGNIPIFGSLYRAGLDASVAGTMSDVAGIGVANDRRQVIGSTLQRNRLDSRGAMLAGGAMMRSAGAANAGAEAQLSASITNRAEALRVQLADSNMSPEARQRLIAGNTATNEAERESLRLQREGQTNADYYGGRISQQRMVGAATGTGATAAQFAAGQQIQTLQFARGASAELAGEHDPARRRQIVARQEGEGAALSAEQGQQRIEFEKNIAQQILQTRSAGNVALLQAQKRGNEAENEALETALAQRVYAVRNATEQEQRAVSVSNSSMRQALRTEQAHRDKGAVMGFTASADVAAMGANQQYRAAGLAAFDAQTRQQMHELPEHLRNPYIDQRARARDSFMQEQERLGASVRIGLAGRSQAAGLSAKGLVMAAGMSGTLTAMTMEARNADAKDKNQVLATQADELRGMRADMLRPRAYATEFDPMRDAAGGPSGQVAKDQLTTLKMMEQYLKSIEDKLKKPPVLN